MVEQIPLKKAEAVAGKIATVLCNTAGIGGLVLSIAQRTPSLPTMSGMAAVNVVLHLGILSAIAYGVLWTIAERIFGWSYGAGAGDSVPTGWSAVVLSLSVTLPLGFVPFLYQRVTAIQVILLPAHWRALFFVVLFGAIGHLVMYGPKSNGIRQRIAPTGEYRTWGSGVLLEAIYSVVFFSCTVLPYRLVVSPKAPIMDLLIRFLLPCLAFFFGMTFFIWFKVPGSLHDPRSIEVRGIVSGILMMFCFCAALFL